MTKMKKFDEQAHRTSIRPAKLTSRLRLIVLSVQRTRFQTHSCSDFLLNPVNSKSNF